jgi:electron transfer flavoprotein-quinone oxidoreductase
VEGGGFLYTNRDSVSVGLVLAMADLREKKRKPYDLLNDFKAHPVVADMLSGGDVLEYSAHVVSTGDVSAVPSKLFGNGVLVAGEAAHLLLNSGKAIQGMDYAMRSGILAAGTVLSAKEHGDFGETTLSAYQEALDGSYLMKDLHSFHAAVEVFHSPTMYEKVPAVLCDFGRQFFGIGNEATPKAREMMKKSIRKHASAWEMLKLGYKAARSL